MQKVETSNAGTIAIIYFDDVTETSICVEPKAVQNYEVSQLKPASVTVYDYYQNCKSCSFLLRVKKNS